MRYAAANRMPDPRHRPSIEERPASAALTIRRAKGTVSRPLTLFTANPGEAATTAAAKSPAASLHPGGRSRAWARRTAQRERHRDAGAAGHDADPLGGPGQRARPADPIDRGQEDHQQGIRVPLDVLAGIEIGTVPGGEGAAVAERDVGVVVDVVAEADGVEREESQQEQERGEHRARQRRPRRSTHGTSTFAQLIAMVEVATSGASGVLDRR
jgi:hypothetical protein